MFAACTNVPRATPCKKLLRYAQEAKKFAGYLHKHKAAQHIVSTTHSPLQTLHPQRRRNAGLTAIELLLVLAIGAILLGIALPAYEEHQRKIQGAIARAGIMEISNSIDTYFSDNFSLPASLDDINMEDKLDPWGNVYQYLRIAAPPGEEVKGKGKLRKDKNLVPINTDYDLYSMGPDGRSVGPLTAKHSRDDIIRANNGAYLGVAENY